MTRVYSNVVSLEDIDVVFSAIPENSDYGVPGSPTWKEFSELQVDSLAILGVEVEFSELPKELQTVILKFAEDIDESEWE